MKSMSGIEQQAWEKLAREELSLGPRGDIEEVEALGIQVPLSFGPFEASWEEITGPVQEVREHLIQPLLAERLRHGLLPGGQAQDILTHELGVTNGWALACFGLGVEHGLLTVSQLNGNRWLTRFSWVYAMFILSPVVDLVERGVLTADEAEVYLWDRHRTIGTAAARAAGAGTRVSSSLERRGHGFIDAFIDLQRRMPNLADLTFLE